MGGGGSGRVPSSERPFAGAIPSIVVRELYAKGVARSGHPVVKAGWLDGASVNLYLVALSNWVDCGLDYQRPGAEPRHADFTVNVSRTRPNYGGQRVWFHCTVSGCCRRVARLHLVFVGLVCRSCAGVRYVSQIQDNAARRRARAAAIRARLDPPGGRSRLPSRPKGMHHQTFERLVDELYQLENTPQPRNEWPPELGWHKKREAYEPKLQWSVRDAAELELMRHLRRRRR